MPTRTFGWISYDKRNKEQNQAVHRAMATMPVFAIAGRTTYPKGGKAFLWECWKDPRVLQATDGKVFPGDHQFTGSCFVPGTPVTLGDGTTRKNIEEVKAGETVLDGFGAPRKVIQPTSRSYTGDLIRVQASGQAGQGNVECTADHQFRTVHGVWAPASELESGRYHLIVNHQGADLSSPLSSRKVTDFKVYCLQVEEGESFLADGIAVHNCVGFGGNQAVFSISAVEVAHLNDPYQALIPFFGLNYGMSRHYMGDDSEGEGSTGTTFAQSVRDDGILPANTPGIDPYRWGDMIEWGSSVEMKWSSYRNFRDKTDLFAAAKKHLIKTIAPLKSSDDVRESLINGYSVTFCGDWGGRMECSTKGTPPVLWNEHVDTWPHQQSCHGWADHPELGEIFYIMNNWGLHAHGGPDPFGGPLGGYWISKKDVDYQCTNGECFAFSQFVGFPSPNWEVNWLI